MDSKYFNKIRIFDGGMGQELLSKGLLSKGTLWSASALIDKEFHKLVIDTHISYINAGADIIVTNNFSARKIRMAQNKVLNKFYYANEQAGILANKAREISKKKILIAGSLPSQSDTYIEDKRSSSEIRADFEEQAKIISPYIDFFYLDVVSSGREIDIASNIIEKLGKKVLVGMHLKKNCKLPSGENIHSIVENFSNKNWIGVVFACVSPEIIEKTFNSISNFKFPYGFKVNLWNVEEPTPVHTFNSAKYNEIGTNPNIALGSRNLTSREFYEFTKRMVEKGATILGGCCETKPIHIKEIATLK